MADLQGVCKDEFAAVRETFEYLFDIGADIGASVAVFVDGEPVVDLWGGYADAAYTRPWERDTIAQTFSSTKTMTALAALVLADRGELDVDAPVARYWPEFGAEGKSGVLVRHVLGHTSGVAGWQEPVSVHDLYDHEKSAALLAAQAPWWAPGTASGYHCYAIGHLVSEVIRRITGRSLGQFFAEEVAGPLGAEFHIGTGPEHDGKVSLLIKGSPDEPQGNRLFTKATLNPRVTPETTWSIPWRRAELGGMNGHGNARGVATAQAVLANGGAFGKRVMSEAGRERVLRAQSDGVDLVLGMPVQWGLGYAVRTPGSGFDFGPRVAYWAGNGGSNSFVDLDARMSFGYVPNRWIRGPYETRRAHLLLQAVYRSLKAT
jgi:CubicO group peptidase (beta-lactamase class C family)